MLQFVQSALQNLRVVVGVVVVLEFARVGVDDHITVGIRDKQLLLGEPGKLRLRFPANSNLQNGREGLHEGELQLQLPGIVHVVHVRVLAEVGRFVLFGVGGSGVGFLLLPLERGFVEIERHFVWDDGRGVHVLVFDVDVMRSE